MTENETQALRDLTNEVRQLVRTQNEILRSVRGPRLSGYLSNTFYALSILLMVGFIALFFLGFILPAPPAP